jgi:hypothetical protein
VPAGAVRGFVACNGDAAKGMANFPDQFTSAKPLVGARFNCAGARAAGTARHTGVYEVRFPGNARRWRGERRAGGDDRSRRRRRRLPVGLWVPGRQDAIDTPFSVRFARSDARA